VEEKWFKKSRHQKNTPRNKKNQPKTNRKRCSDRIYIVLPLLSWRVILQNTHKPTTNKERRKERPTVNTEERTDKETVIGRLKRGAGYFVFWCAMHGAYTYIYLYTDNVCIYKLIYIYTCVYIYMCIVNFVSLHSNFFCARWRCTVQAQV